MKIARPLVALLAALSLGACASSGNTYAERPVRSSPSSVDTTKVALVEKAAYQRGLQVVWVNPPEKPRPPLDR
ncbi:hypothetical protein [Chiayiivirga flava]|uniref:Lipoprotein n=1 Tax=Chiayiivirga flava TaxID=659595 RepID=A0A7W8D7T4_9GAMM|nr:hypothetical protein [Chiayiivirga flava]MBB5209494.1 hypothetical protein [Chiayiivirga flava]